VRGMGPIARSSEMQMKNDFTGATLTVRDRFPGLAALVNSFDAAVSRSAASKVVLAVASRDLPPDSGLCGHPLLEGPFASVTRASGLLPAQTYG
jgi:hypothetical protein